MTNFGIQLFKIGNTQESSFFIVERKKEMHQRNIRIPKKVKKVDVSGESGCRLLDKFLQGDRLEHNQRFAILTNCSKAALSSGTITLTAVSSPLSFTVAFICIKAV